MTVDERQIVYIVTSGSYSDYGINAVFLDRSEAERWVQQNHIPDQYDLYGSSFEIEEYEVGESSRERIRYRYSLNNQKGHDPWERLIVMTDPSEASRFMVHYDGQGNVYRTDWCLVLEAETPEQALKIASEQKAQMLTGQVPYPVYTDRNWKEPEFIGVYVDERGEIVSVDDAES